MFHLRVKIIGRSTPGGRSVAGAVAYRVGSRNGAAAMAYRAGEKLRDPNSGRTFDYSKKARIDSEGFGILHTEVMLPVGAPAWMADRQKLIDAIEAKETRSDAQLLREIEISLPRELTFAQQRELVRSFVQAAFVAHGMVADIAIHDERAADGGRNPHAHVLLTMRSVNAEGFGNKVRAWNAKALVTEWRALWAEMANDVLAANGFERRLDHRSHREREIELEPDTYVGPSKGRNFNGVLHAARRESREAGKQQNIEAIAANPAKLLDAITREKATFTRGDVAFALRRATALETDDPLFSELIEQALASRDIVAIGSDQQGATRYATRSMIQCEVDMARAALTLARRQTFDLYAAPPGGLSLEQKQAFLHVTQGSDFAAITGIAGAGKTTLMAAVARAFQDSGHRVRGAALAGIAARQLTQEAGIPAATLRATFARWDHKNRDGLPDPINPLQRGDVFILDEAGMVASRDMRRLLCEAERVGAKVILVGDSQQLQAIEAGAAFRALVDTHGAAGLHDVRRQRQDWQREATTLLSKHRAPEALAHYRGHQAVHGARTTEDAINHLVADYMADRLKGESQLVLAYYRADVRALNESIRMMLRGQGAIGADVRLTTRELIRGEGGEIIQERPTYDDFAVGDRIVFGMNDRTLGVDNGTLGNVLSLDASGQLEVELTDGRRVAFSTRDYPDIAHGYAMTIHKSQGATFDRTYVLASARMDASLAYVALTRHREATGVYYGSDQFASPKALDRVFARQRPKDSTLDYLDAYHARQRGEERAQSGEGGRAPPHSTPVTTAPLSAADRIRQNAVLRQQALQRDRGRDRTYGE